MKRASLSALAATIGAELFGTDAHANSVSTDTRTLKPGDIFVALQGERFDAKQFLAHAESAGAVAAVVPERVLDSSISQLVVADTLVALGKIAAWHRQHFLLPIVGLTGSVGKTSCKELLASIFEQRGSVLATKGNLNNEIGVPLTLLGLDAKHDFAVIEMGAANLGDIAYLGRLAQPTIALVTTVAAAHLEGFGSIENIAITKAEIYQSLGVNDVAVVGLDNQYTRQMLESIESARVITFSSAGADATVTATEIAQGDTHQDSPSCFSFRLNLPSGSAIIQLSVPGEFMVHNAVAAASCAYAAGIDIEIIQQGLEQFAGFQQRMITQKGIANSVIIDDSYNANPASMKAAIDVLASMQGYRVLAMGFMAELGPDSDRLHAEIGAYAAEQGIDALFAVGDSARQSVAAFSEQGVACADHAECIELCQRLAIQHAENSEIRVCFLAKGSRSARMEKVVAGLSLLEGAS